MSANKEAEIISVKLGIIETVASILSETEDVSPAIHSTLDAILHFFDGNRSYIFEINSEKNTATNTFERCADSVKAEIDNLQNVGLEDFKVWIDAFSVKDFIYIKDIDDLEGGRSEEREFLRAQNIKELITVPMYDSGRLFGFIGIDDPRKNQSESDFLKTVGGIISGEIVKHRLYEKARSTAEDLRHTINSIPCGIAVLSPTESGICPDTVNDGFSKILGKSRTELIELYKKDPYWGIHPDDIEAVKKTVSKAVIEKKSYTCLYRTLVSNGEYRWVRSVSDFSDGKIFAELSDIDELKKTERALLYRDELSKLLLDDRDTLTFDFDIERGAATFNTPLPSGERSIITVSDYRSCIQDLAKYAPEHSELMSNKMQEASQKPTTDSLEFKGSLFGEKQIWYRTLYKSIADSNGKVMRIIGKATNIQREKTLRQRFEQEKARLSALEADLVTVICINISKNRLVEIDSENPDAESLITDIDGTAALSNISAKMPDVRQRARFMRTFNSESLLNSFAVGKTSVKSDYRRMLPDCSVRWVECEANMTEQPESGDIVAFIYVRDINDRKQTDILIRSVVESEFDLVAQTDCASGEYILYAGNADNSEVSVTRGRDFFTVVSERIDSMLCEEDKERIHREMTFENVIGRLESEGDYSLHYGIIGKNNSKRTMKLHIFYSDDTSGVISFVRTDVSDVYAEEQRKNKILRDALESANLANSAKSNFLSSISHDIRTPMHAIIGMTSIATAHSSDTVRVEDCLGKITVASRHLLSLINDVLDMSRIECGKLRLNEDEINIPSLFSELITLIMPQIKAAKLHFSADTANIKDENVIGDKLRLTQMFINILGNSCKFTPAGGSVSVRMEQIEPKIRSRASYRLTFCDTGIGMDKEFAERIFEPFERAKTSTDSGIEGTGLGLAITKSVVDLMGGDITVNSELSKGTVITVEISLTPTETIVSADEGLRGKRVLVVSGNGTVCIELMSMLADTGVFAETVESGRSAAEAVEATDDSGRPYDIVIVDSFLHDTDGVGAAEKIRSANGGDKPKVFIADYDTADISNRAAEAGVTGFIPRPFFRSTLYSSLHSSGNLPVSVPKAAPPDLSGKCVLLVEDNELGMEINSEIVGSTGAEILKAYDGQEAVEIVESSPEGKIDFILCDIQMPGMNGYETVRAIRALPRRDVKTIPIYALTADAFISDAKLAIEAGMNGHIAKPVDTAYLYSVLANNLHKIKE